MSGLSVDWHQSCEVVGVWIQNEDARVESSLTVTVICFAVERRNMAKKNEDREGEEAKQSVELRG